MSFWRDRISFTSFAVVGIVGGAGFAMLAWMEPDMAPDPAVLELPWEQPEMVVTEPEAAAARDLTRYLRTLPGEGNQGRVRELEWTQGWYNRPIGNLDRAALRQLLVGNSFVHHTAILDPQSRQTNDQTHLYHFGTDGILRTCLEGHRKRFRYRVVPDLIGAATYVTQYIDNTHEPLTVNQDDTGWWRSFLEPGKAWPHRPITFDAVTGTLAIHSETEDGLWEQRIGHVQAAPLESLGTACSERQGSAGGRNSVKEIDRAIRTVVPLFRQDPDKPLRMGIYFALYPPPAAPS
ncbi:MAG: hypothetical protein OXF88_15975 [Rhodobacteraceae bacterium]|nr:hypothetical protein [Paracoccaceae bacterium]